MVDKFFTARAGRDQSGLSPLSTVYDVSDGSVTTSGAMSEVASTGNYYVTHSITSAGSYLVEHDFSVDSSATVPTKYSEGFLITSSAVAADTLSNLSTTYLHVKYRLDDLEPNLGTGSANIVSQAISGAAFEASQLSGKAITDSDLTYPVADLAAAEVVESMLGRDDIPVSNEREAMANSLVDRGYRKLKAMGVDTRYKFTNK